jgi:hypothetical protein
LIHRELSCSCQSPLAMPARYAKDGVTGGHALSRSIPQK